MRSNSKAPSIGSTLRRDGHRRGAPRGRRLTLVLFAALFTLALAIPSAALAARTYESQLTNGSAFISPTGITVDGSDNLWVIDPGNNSMLSKFDSSGAFLAQNDGAGLWGGFSWSQDLAFGASAGLVYVVDSNGDDIWGVNLDTTYAGVDLENALWGAGCCFLRAAVDNSGGANDGDIYVASSNATVTRIDGTGAASNFSASASYISANQLTGTPDHAFSGAGSIATDAGGNVYVADPGHAEVDQFDPTGTFVRAFTGSSGSIGDVAVDPTSGNVLIGDLGLNLIHEFDSTGTFIEDISGAETPAASFSPIGLALDSAGRLYVADDVHSVVDVFAAAGPPPVKHNLTLTTEGSGTGTVTSAPSGIDCGATCEHEFVENSAVTLTATPDVHNEFTAWSGCDAEPSPTECEVAIGEADQQAAATFTAIPQQNLEVSLAGAGTVTSSPSGIQCPATCAEHFDHNSTVTLTAAPDVHNEFTGWSGPGAEASGCDETGATFFCEVEIHEADAQVAASFTAIPQQLIELTIQGSGEGSVASSPAGIECEASCNGEFDQNKPVTLTATSKPHSKFLGWSGPDAGSCATEPSCEIALAEASAALSAEFEAIPQKELTVQLSGSGKVGNTGFEIECPEGAFGGTPANDCSSPFDEGALVTLVAIADPHNEFSAWSNCPLETTYNETFPACEVTMSEDTIVGAQFAPITHDLAVSVAGGGSISADSGAISGCTASTGTCEGTYQEGTEITLTATPDAHQALSAWSGGGCSGTGLTCTLTLEADTALSATFAPITHTLSVTRTGLGTVTSSPPGINCGVSCSALFAEASAVTLTATPTAHTTFSGWGGAGAGACAAAPSCEVTLGTANLALSATFAQNKPLIAGESAAALTQHAATLSATVNPEGANVTSCQFEWGTSAAYGTKVPCSSLPGSGTEAKAVSIPALSGLAAGTTYHYRVDATNSGGSAEGTDHSFTTLADTCATNTALCPPPPVTTPPSPPPPADTRDEAAYKVCVKKADKAYKKALKKARSVAQKKAAKKRKAKAIKKCAASFL